MLSGQFYWLYNQYQYCGNKMAGEFKKVCSQTLRNEEILRNRLRIESRRDTDNSLRMKIKIQIKQDSFGKSVSSSTFSYTTKENGKITVKGKGLNADDGSVIYDRYLISSFKPFQKPVFNSLLVAKGLPAIENFKRIKEMPLKIKPQYTVTNGWEKRLKVVYCNNPMLHEGISFVIPIPMSQIMRTMLWQLLASVLLLFVLAFCLLYQVKTIMIQKRIDNIRHEFMKNMIFELKQPKENSDETSIVHLGDTDFHYDLNELQYRNNRVILTSRQTEIFKMLSDSPNNIVPREQILSAAWGDDSYANSMALNVQISYLRRAIKSDPKLSIDVIYKKGYILNVKH